VLVVYEEKEESKKGKKNKGGDDASSVGSLTTEGGELSVASGSLAMLSQNGALYPGTVLKAWGDGKFDVHYDMGGKEVKCARERIVLEEAPPWETVYVGKELSYAVEASVPDVILEREPGINVQMDFVLQVRPAHMPLLPHMPHTCVNKGGCGAN